MNQTPNIIPDPTISAKSFGDAFMEVSSRIDALGLDMQKFVVGDIARITRVMFTDTGDGLSCDQNDLDEAIRSIIREIDTMPGCDSQGELVPSEGHYHSHAGDTFGRFTAQVIHDGEKWMVDLCHEATGDELGDEILDYADALRAAAGDAAVLNDPTLLRRPTDYCAEPHHDGNGGL
jgi:hypothetical protein